MLGFTKMIRSIWKFSKRANEPALLTAEVVRDVKKSHKNPKKYERDGRIVRKNARGAAIINAFAALFFLFVSLAQAKTRYYFHISSPIAIFVLFVAFSILAVWAYTDFVKISEKLKTYGPDVEKWG